MWCCVSCCAVVCRWFCVVSCVVVCVRCGEWCDTLKNAVCPLKTSPCVCSKLPRVYRQDVHTCFNMCAWCRCTRGRFERTHGHVLSGHGSVRRRARRKRERTTSPRNQPASKTATRAMDTAHADTPITNRSPQQQQQQHADNRAQHYEGQSTTNDWSRTTNKTKRATTRDTRRDTAPHNKHKETHTQMYFYMHMYMFMTFHNGFMFVCFSSLFQALFKLPNHISYKYLFNFFIFF